MADLERLKPMPLLPVALAVIAGIVATRLTDSLWIAAVCSATAAFLAAAKRYLYSAWALAAALGALSYYVASGADHSADKTDSRMRIYEANIGKVSDNDNSISADIDIVGAGATADDIAGCRRIAARLTCPAALDSLRPGYTIIFRGSLQPITPQIDLPDEIDPAQLHIDRNIHCRTFVEPGAIISFEKTPGFSGRMSRMRDCIVDAIYRSSLKPETKIFIAVTLLGDTSELSADTRNRFSAAGLSHILALSGLHVGIISLIITIALWPLHAAGKHTLLALSTMVLLWGYAALTGFSPSVSRAVIMASIYLLGRMLQRNTSPFNSLAAAAVIILLPDPQALFSAGFQLSFCAVAAIIMFAERFNPVSRRRRVAYTLASYISVSICAIIGTAIPSCIYFHTFPLLFIAGNLIASLILPFLIAAGVCLTVLELAGHDPQWLCSVIDLLYSIIDRSAEIFGSLPGAVINNIYLPGVIAAAYAASVGALFLWLRRPTTLRCGIFVGLLIATFAVAIFSSKPVREPRLYFARNSYHTDLVVDNLSPTLIVISSAPQERLDILSRARFRYRDFMGRREIDSIAVVADRDFQAPGIARNRNRIKFDRHTLQLIAGPIDKSETLPSEYAIVCRGFKGKISEVIAAYHPDTIILSSDLHPNRSGQFAEECRLAGQPIIDMRSRRWSLGATPPRQAEDIRCGNSSD